MYLVELSELLFTRDSRGVLLVLDASLLLFLPLHIRVIDKS